MGGWADCRHAGSGAEAIAVTMRTTPTEPVPVSIVTGFLGAGKTTLINRLLKDPALIDTAVIVNEFGDVGIDHLLVEQANDGIIELSDGCLCCTVRGALVDTLAALIDRLQTGRIAALKRIVIETTGLADPAPVLHAVMGHPALVQSLRLDGVITVVDAVNGETVLNDHAEAVKQVAVADRLVVTKLDLAADGRAIALSARLAALNPGAPRLPVLEAQPGRLFDCGLYDPATKSPKVARWLREEAYGRGDARNAHTGAAHTHAHAHDVNRHDRRIRAFTLIEDRPIDPAALDMFINLLRSAHAEKLLRMKGIVALSDDPDRPVAIHGVQALFHPPARLPGWPDPADRRTRLVLITRDLSPRYVEDLFGAFAGVPAADRPDRSALLDNPLAIAGMGQRR